ncbi:hypothetical protein OAJ94_01085 [Deltaproteobacteria bacterium]|nr:hypothetical protein [Deltaproteobacteria bacterium]
MPSIPIYMAKITNVGDAPVQPIRRRRARGDRYETLFLMLWLLMMVLSFGVAFWLASTENLLFGFEYHSSTDMKRFMFILCVSFWAFCSFSLLRFDALAKQREKTDFGQKMDRFHELDKRHIEREALQLDLSIDKIRSSTAKSDGSEEKKTVVEISSESKGEAAEDSPSSEE